MEIHNSTGWMSDSMEYAVEYGVSSMVKSSRATRASFFLDPTGVVQERHFSQIWSLAYGVWSKFNKVISFMSVASGSRTGCKESVRAALVKLWSYSGVTCASGSPA